MSSTKDVTLSFKLPYEVKQLIRKKAKLANLTQSDFMNSLLANLLVDFNPPRVNTGAKYKPKLITHSTENDI